MSLQNGKDYLYLIWQDSVSRRQFIVGQLSKNGRYEFRYTDDISLALKAGFQPLVAFEDISKTYYSDQLFPAVYQIANAKISILSYKNMV